MLAAICVVGLSIMLAGDWWALQARSEEVVRGEVSEDETGWDMRWIIAGQVLLMLVIYLVMR